MDAIPAPPSLKTPRDLALAWPRCAQLAAAFLFGAAVALLGLHGCSFLRSGTEPASSDGPRTLGYRVDLNTATRGELLQLPGVGPALAERIEEYRRLHGGYAGVDDLLKVGGIGPTTLERLRPLVEVRPLAKMDAVGATAKGQTPVLAVPNSTAAKAPKKATGLAGPINVNRASLQELQQLPGIGPKISQRIVDERTKKAFASVDDLRRVPGIGPKTLDKLRPYVTVDLTAQAGEPK
jgi:competence protein ComEA